MTGCLTTVRGMAKQQDEPAFQVSQKARNVFVVDVALEGRQGEALFLLSGDRHHDNPHTDHALELRHLQMAKDQGMGIVDVGDLFCAMEGRADPRRHRSGVRPEHATVPDYFDSIVRHAADFYAPFAKNFIVIGLGNHETAVLKNQETNLTERLCERMTTLSKHKVYPGGYGNWIIFRSTINTRRFSLIMKTFHGSGGGGLMTADVLRTRRIASWTPDADVIVGGHTHDQWWMALARERLQTLNGTYRVELDTQHHVRTGTYKDEYGDGFSGFHVERGAPPKPTGAIVMRIFLENMGQDRHRLACDFRRA